MARIRVVAIENFRSLKSLYWEPGEGLNCLIGTGDSGKSTILDAIDLCLGARRAWGLSDTDFYELNVSEPIVISLTIGDLPDRLKGLEPYGDCLRGFECVEGRIEDEPGRNLETVLTLRLTVTGDLEPVWSLYSERTAHLDPPRMLQWKDRLLLAPLRLGHQPNSNLSWTRGSVLNRLGDERAEVGPALVNAAREARARFGVTAAPQLAQTLKTVTDTAQSLGINVGAQVTALLDAHAVSFGEGAVALHSESGVPLRSMGTGSTRLLIAGLHHAAAGVANIVLVDEVEHGLEPHRINRLLDSLGAKSSTPLQVFMTTHSPVVLRELSAKQLNIVRSNGEQHVVLGAGDKDDTQAAIRLFPEAFLAKTVIICEGASEIGLLKGLDQLWTERGYKSLQAAGVSCVDAGGGEPDRAFKRAAVFQRLGFRVAVFQDNDKVPSPEVVTAFIAGGGMHVAWREGRALEDELFTSLPSSAVSTLISRALELTEDGLVNSHIATASQGQMNLASVQQEGAAGQYSISTRELLGHSSRTRRGGWFKSIGKMSDVAYNIVGPHWQEADPEFKATITALMEWAYKDA